MGTFLGIDKSTKQVYEHSESGSMPATFPNPVITPVAFSELAGTEKNAPKYNHFYSPDFLFREDSFDPISRIRRGRFFQKDTDRETLVLPHPSIHAYSSEKVDGLVKKKLFIYQSYSLFNLKVDMKLNELLISLGYEKTATLWSIINIESIHTGEELVTLKSRQSLGALPKVNWTSVPNCSLNKLREDIECLERDYLRASPESVVDRAREATSSILSAWLQSEKHTDVKGKDLGKLIELFELSKGRNSGRIIRCAAEIPQRLHSRGKRAEKDKQTNLRQVMEQDAEMALQCVGIILCDLGWAEW